MNEHDGGPGDRPVGEPDSEPTEHERLDDQPDLAEHEAAVPSAAEDRPLDPTENTPSTGDDRVDEALTRLAELDRLEVTEHAGVVEDVHRALQDTLAEEAG
ncbi:MAG TPA: hypothetical protein VFZ37_19430 [Jiangellaceae bacterium]